jgi:3-polyprenyl-4-hydroxybenzoate decarboxylase
MSKFQSTVSTVAALASIFGAAAAGWKLAEANSNVPPSALDQKIEILEKKLDQAVTKPSPVQELPQAQYQIAPTPPILAPLPPTPPISDEKSEESNSTP